MHRDTVTRVVNGVDQHALVDAVARSVAIPSVGGTPAEIAIQDSLARDLAAAGLEVETWDIDIDALAGEPGFPGMEVPRSRARGVLGRWRGTGDGPSLLLLGHTDVVPPGDRSAWTGDPFALRVADGFLVGRGACDMKSGLAAAVMAVRAVRSAGLTPRGDILVAPVVGEEDGGLGTYALLRRGIGADAAIIPEPTGLALVPANAGALTFRLRIRGRSTHASRRAEGVSAIDLLAPVTAALERLERRRNADADPLMSRWALPYPISLGTLQAGDWASTVPDLLVAEGRLGVALGEDPGTARAALEAELAGLGAAEPWFGDHPVEVEWWGGQFASGRTDPHDPVITGLAEAHTRIRGTEPDVHGAPYGSDLRLLTAAGIPTVQYGPGDSADAHAPDERVPVEAVVDCARVLALALAASCGR